MAPRVQHGDDMIFARKSSKLRKQVRGTTSLTSQGLHARNTLESGAGYVF